MANTSATNKLFWIDMEMTGLDERTCKVLEVAVIVTDLDFAILEEYQKVVRQPVELLEAMDDWCKKTHGASGLSKAVPDGTPLDTVEKEVIDLIDRHFNKSPVVICGNSVGQDRRFIDAYMPDLAKRLHYRIIDVTSFKEIFHRKFGVSVSKQERHRALDDIRESIAELAHYVSHVTPPKKPTGD